ncbi:MAG TPA: hypothetical protein VN914_13565, partial [Polyangia bacterium]|nr:hypothetical protein [Polyangia bacterium]
MAPVCPSCRAHLEPALPLCVACGKVFPEEDDQVRALMVRRLPEEQRARTEVHRLLAASSGRDELAVARYLERGRAVFRL